MRYIGCRKKIETLMIIVGLLLLIGVMGMIERGWFDWLGLLAMASLVVPIVITLRKE